MLNLLDQLPRPQDDSTIARVGNDYYLTSRIGSTNKFVRMRLKKDAASSTSMYDLKEQHVYSFQKWNCLSSSESTLNDVNHWGTFQSGGYWGNRILSSFTGASYVEFTISANSGDDLYLAIWERPEGSWCYVTIDGSTALVNELPTSGANKYIDTYAASAADRQVLVASNLTAGSHTVRITKSLTEKNASATSDYYLSVLAFAVTGPNKGLYYRSSDMTVLAWPYQIRGYNGVSYSEKVTDVYTGSGPTGVSALGVGGSDIIYVGSSASVLTGPFTSLKFTSLTSTGSAGTITVSYWNGSAWTALTITDGTSNLTASGTISWIAPSDWTAATVDGVERFWVRITRSAARSVTWTHCEIGVAATGTRLFIAQADGSQAAYAFVIQGTPDTDVGGELHGDEAGSAVTIEVDGTPTVLADGQSATGEVITVSQTMTASDGSGAFADGELTWTWENGSLDCDWQYTMTSSRVLKSFAYYAMCPWLAWDALGTQRSFNKFKIMDAGRKSTIHTQPDDDAIRRDRGHLKGSGFVAWADESDASDYVGVLYQRNATRTNYRYNLSGNRQWLDMNPSTQLYGGGSSVVVKAYSQAISDNSTLTAAAGFSFGSSHQYTLSELAGIEAYV